MVNYKDLGLVNTREMFKSKLQGFRSREYTRDVQESSSWWLRYPRFQL